MQAARPLERIHATADERPVELEDQDTTKLLAHAAHQTRKRKRHEHLIVEVDSHYFESDRSGT